MKVTAELRSATEVSWKSKAALSAPFLAAGSGTWQTLPRWKIQRCSHFSEAWSFNQNSYSACTAFKWNWWKLNGVLAYSVNIFGFSQSEGVSIWKGCHVGLLHATSTSPNTPPHPSHPPLLCRNNNTSSWERCLQTETKKHTDFNDSILLSSHHCA